MRRAWGRQRAQLFQQGGAQGPPRGEGRHAGKWVGRDLRRRRSSLRALTRLWLPVLLGTVAAALLLASVRVSILRIRYELAAALTRETELLEQKRAATVAVRELRNPARLHRLAADLGLARPEHVIELAIRPRTP